MNCVRCGVEHEMTPGDYLKREQLRQRGEEYTTPKRCAQCRWERRQPVDVVCGQCRRGFTDRVGRVEDLEWAHKRPLCEECRP